MNKPILLSFFLVAIAVSALFTIFSDRASDKLVSPKAENEKVLGVNLWFPSAVSGVQADGPNITANAALFIDSKTGQTLYAKNPTKKLPVASLVKVMTALVALEHKSFDDQFLVSQRAAQMEPDKMLLITGEKLTLKELLYGIFLISANDGAEVLAEGTTGNRQQFIELMNKKAKQLGMNNTYFANPTGLDEDSNNSYSTAYDLAILTRYLIRHFPQVVEISRTPHIYFPITENHQDYDMYTGINLITTYPGVVGFKTGYTPEAGLTLITLAQKNGHDLPDGRQEIIGVLLGSASRRDEARELLDYSFEKLKFK